jgi:predicted XRE-type DNA-binding protein
MKPESNHETVDLLPELRAHIARKYINQAGAAKAWGITRAMVSKVMTGKARPSQAMLDDAGIEAVHSPVRYVRKKG